MHAQLAAAAAFPEPVTRRLESLLDRLAARRPLRHAVMGVARGDGSAAWMGARGTAAPDAAPMRADTPWYIASIDKLFNAVITMRLVERGQVDLDAAIRTYLPDEMTTGLHRWGGVDHSDRITVRHLLSHTSGLADWLEDRPRGGQAMVDRILADGDRALTLEEMVRIAREELRPHFPPQDPASSRARVRYSDTNFILIAAIIERVASRPLHEVLHDELFAPLGLRRTFLPGLSEPADPVDQVAALSAGGRPLAIPKLLASFRGICSTVPDMLVLLGAIVRGDVFAGPATFEAMQRHWHRFGLPTDPAAWRAPSWPIEYGLGLMRFRLPRVLTPFSPVPAVVGHSGSTGTWLFYCPRWDLLLTGAVNEVTAVAVPYRVMPRILKIVGPPPGGARVSHAAGS